RPDGHRANGEGGRQGDDRVGASGAAQDPVGPGGPTRGDGGRDLTGSFVTPGVVLPAAPIAPTGRGPVVGLPHRHLFPPSVGPRRATIGAACPHQEGVTWNGRQSRRL